MAKATVRDVHEIAASMPEAERIFGTADNPIYQVRRKSFVYFRNPRPDAVDPDTGERYTDVIVFWVESESDKLALVEDDATPFFTTPHFDGYAAVLLRAGRLDELDRSELAEVIADSWLVRAPKRLAAAWLAENPHWPAEA